MTAARVLVVEDNKDNLEILALTLGEIYDVLSCASAQEALTTLKAAKPDLVMLDIGMAPIDGLQCLEAIRALPGYGDLPAIALTAYAHDAERTAFLAAGFQAVVTKPIIDHKGLFATISAVLASVAVPSLNGLAGDPAAFKPACLALTQPVRNGMFPLCGFDHPAKARAD